MNALYAGIINEINKIFLRKRNNVFLLISGLIAVSSVLFFKYFETRLNISLINVSDICISQLGGFVNILIPLLIFMVSADLFAGEAGANTLKVTLIRPISRYKVFFAKSTAVIFYVIINLLFVLIFSFVSGAVLKFGIGGFNGILLVLEAYAAALVPLICLIIFASFICQFFKTGSGALALCIFIYTALKIGPLFFSKLSKVVFTSYMDWYMLWLGKVVPMERLSNIFFMFTSYSIIFFTLGFYFFDARDV